MRRKDLQLKKLEEVLAVIEGCDVCRLGLAVDNMPYIVAMNFGYEYLDGQLTLYFHSAREGRKLSMLEQNPYVCFQMDRAHHLLEDKMACKMSMDYESVIGYGKISFAEKPEEKRHALEKIVAHYAEMGNPQFSEQSVNAVAILRLDAEMDKLSGKRHKK